MLRHRAAAAGLGVAFSIVLIVLSVRWVTGASRALVDGISIEGDKEFIERTRAALDLLKERHRDAHVAMTKQVLTIRQSEKSGADVWTRCIQVADRTSTYSTTWYASSLVHDCRHVSLYNDYVAAYPGQSVPPDVYSGQDAELACMRTQIEALIRLNAPQTEIDWARKQDGTFYDIDKNGTYDENDYKKRNW